MPKSKSTRKNGKQAKGGFRALARLRKISSSAKRLSGMTPDQIRRIVHIEQKRSDEVRSRSAKLVAIFNTRCDPDMVRDAFIRSQLAVRRWDTTEDVSDFNIVASTLMLGYLTYVNMKLEDHETLESIRNASYIASVSFRLRWMGKHLPQANIDVVRTGLTTAQFLIEEGLEEAPQAVWDAFYINTAEFTRLHPEIHVQKQRALLGRYADQVLTWEQEELECKLHIHP